MTYFLTSKSPGVTRVDLLSIKDMKDFVKSIKVLDQVILVQTKVNNMCLKFDKRTQLLVDKIKQKKSSVLTQCYDGKQFVLHRLLNNTSDIFKYTYDEKSMQVRANVDSNLKSIRTEI
jgi:hypothetical protein